jgi:dTDP-4-dehydrorhamnose 3,5-epimerase
LTEIYSPLWGFDSIPIVYLYTVTVFPGKVEGCAVHYQQVDRYFFYAGSAKLVLYDDRPGSRTYGIVNEIYFSETNRSVVLVPPHVFHAVQNVGRTDVLLINFPSVPYRHQDPDKHTLPLDNSLIAYKFHPILGY